MKKEEILEASKKENKKKDLYSLQVETKAATIAAIAMVTLAFIYFTYDIITGNGVNAGFYSLITLYNAVLYGYKAIKVKEHRALSSFTAIIWLALTIMLILEYFKVI